MFHVLTARHAAVAEYFVREQPACYVLARMQRKRMVLGEEPHDIVALFGEPVAVSQHAFAELAQKLLGQYVLSQTVHPYYLGEPEVRAVGAPEYPFDRVLHRTSASFIKVQTSCKACDEQCRRRHILLEKRIDVQLLPLFFGRGDSLHGPELCKAVETLPEDRAPVTDFRREDVPAEGVLTGERNGTFSNIEGLSARTLVHNHQTEGKRRCGGGE